MEPTTSSAGAGRAWRQLPLVLWLIPIGFLAAAVGTFEPWFRPSVDGQVIATVHAWTLSRLGLLTVVGLLAATIQLLVVAFARTAPSRPDDGPPFLAPARRCMIICTVALVVLGLVWYFVPGHYDVSSTKFVVSANLDTQIQQTDASVARGVTIGFLLTLAGCLLALAASVIALVPYGSGGKGKGITHIPPPSDDPGSAHA